MDAEFDLAKEHVRAAYSATAQPQVPLVVEYQLLQSAPEFPRNVRHQPNARVPVPVVLLPDPSVLREWAERHNDQIEQDWSSPTPPEGRPAWLVTRYFEASQRSAQCVDTPLPWLTHTDEAARDARVTLDLTLGRATEAKTVINLDPNYPSSCGAGRHLGQVDSRVVAHAIIQLGPGRLWSWDSTKFAFPILDANGGARGPATDRYAAVRHGPYQSIVESPDFDPRIGTHSLLILPWPESNDPRLQRPARVQERLCIHEDMAKLDPPIITVRTLPGSTPFREDYLLQAECDFETADDLVMVVIFANASTEQLSRLFESLGKAAKAQAAPDDPGSSTPEPAPQK